MGTEITKYDDAWAAAGKKFVEREKPTAATLSIAGGAFKLGDDEIEGNQLCVVIVDSVFENAYYEGEWDPQRVVPPTCYAMAHDEDELAPHPAMQEHEFFQPQHSECAGCPMNEWGSAEKGRGKACKNRRRLSLIPAGYYTKVKGTKNEFEADIIEDEAHYKDADALILKLPVTSGKEYSKYLKSVMANYQRPPYGVITRIYIEHGGSNQFTVKFETLEVFPSEYFNTLKARHDQAKAEIIVPYSAPDDDAAGEAQATAKTRLGGLRRGR